MPRPIQEINAGSMADIAFLLLIFFLVTTTMDVDAGISRNLPLKRELPPDFEFPEVHERDVLEILANSNDQLMVEREFIQLEDLRDIVMDFYTANDNGQDNNPNMPLFEVVNPGVCNGQIAGLNAQLLDHPDNVDLRREVEKWESKLQLCSNVPGGQYYEMSNMSIVQLKNQANTSYGLYIEVQNILKSVVNELRLSKCSEMGWGDYFELEKSEEVDDQEKVKMLRVLVPERIVEARIDR